jgi:hypothetical protein
MLRSIGAGLLDDVVGTYDQTKTTIAGRVLQSVINSNNVLGPPLNRYIDPVADSTVAPVAQTVYLSPNGRLFMMSGEVSGIVSILLYDFNLTTGIPTYIGRLQFNLPDVAATTHTFRSIKVLDTGTTGWKFAITTTASVLINGGTFLINNVNRSDFVQVGFITIPFATGNNQKAVYFMQDSTATGVAHPQTVSAGSAYNPNTGRLYVHNGSAATHQYYVYDMAPAPTYSTFAATGVAATDVISCAGHPFVDNDPVTFVTLTGGAGLAVVNTYFVRNSVPGVSFQVSATSGGAAINFTTDISAATIGRAFGTSHTNFLFKTGNLPALSGTLLQTDSEDYALPQHTVNAGQDCVFFATSSVLYIGLMSELTVGATSWPSLVSANTLGAPSEIVTPTLVGATWSNVLDRAIFSTGLIFMMKQMVNNDIDVIFGGTNNKFFENQTSNVVELQPGSTINGLDIEAGWLVFLSVGVVGQRGVYSCDLRSDCLFDYSYIITKVLDTPQSVYKYITTIDELYDFTGSLQVFYRTSGFGSPTGGWIEIPFAQDLEGITTAGDQVQFKICFATLGLDTCIPAQLIELFLGYDDIAEMSANYAGDNDNTTQGTGGTQYLAFVQRKLYATAPTEFNIRAFDSANTLIINLNTTVDSAVISHSTDGGTSWSPGIGPNQVDKRLRALIATPPGTLVFASIREA